MFHKPHIALYVFATLCALFLFTPTANAQNFNIDVVASIRFEKSSEYYTFYALAENKTSADLNLRYEYMVFKSDENGNTSKSSQGNRFFSKANQIEVLSSVTINYAVESKIIIVLLIYDDEDKPIGQERIELPNGGRTELNTAPTKQNETNPDQAKPEDGFYLKGLVIENTITKAGRDFYRYFFSEYYNKNISTKHNIKIEEVPGRSRNTLINIYVKDQLIWRFFSQPRKEFLKEQVEITMARVIRQLQYLEKQQFDTKF